MATDEEKEQRAARRRLRRGAGKLTEKMTKDIAIAYKPIEEWDWEELSRGRPRNKSGTFIGPKPGPLTPAIEQERRRRITQLTMAEIAAQAKDALSTIHRLMTDRRVDDDGRPMTPPKVQLDAATFFVEHLIGKATATIDVQSDNALRDLMADVIVNRDGNPSHMVIEGTVVADDPLDDEEDDDGGPVLLRPHDENDDS